MLQTSKLERVLQNTKCERFILWQGSIHVTVVRDTDKPILSLHLGVFRSSTAEETETPALLQKENPNLARCT